ncbi:tumor necrosis factor receptor superfamily member 8 [Ctenodactylus gundi]
MYCSTSATNSCARCSRHSTCPKGKVVKVPGTAEKDTVCGPPSPGTDADCSGPEACRTPARCPPSPLLLPPRRDLGMGLFNSQEAQGAAGLEQVEGPRDRDLRDSAALYTETQKAETVQPSPPYGTNPQTKPTVTSPAGTDARTMLLKKDTSFRPDKAPGPTGTPRSPSLGAKHGPDPGPSLSQPCPLGSADCGKQCEPDYYLDGAGRCTACVSCVRDDLVEKAPCSWNSSRVCECRPGLVCATSATNSCARCVARPVCALGMMAKLQAVPDRDPTFEPPPPEEEIRPDCSTLENSEAPASTTPAQANQALPISTSAPVSLSSTGKPLLDPGPVLFWVAMGVLLVAGISSFLLCHRRACRKRIHQKIHLCYPAQSFRPKLEPVDSRPRKNLAQPRSDELETELDTEKMNMVSLPAVETCVSVEAACPESLQLLDASPAGVPPAPRDPSEPRVSAEHTNNRIEKIYIMKADTVIVGTVKTEAPEGRGLAVPADPELEVGLDVDHVPHYPEQETEPPLGSCPNIMFSVEEEGKVDPWPETTSEK